MRKGGFTIIEILIVVTIIGILLSIVIPQYKNSVIKAKEAVLKENLYQIRDAISKYFQDKSKYPASLEDLVQSRYLRAVPVDPFSGEPDWIIVRYEPLDFEDLDLEEAEGIVDVKSKSKDPRGEGKDYGNW